MTDKKRRECLITYGPFDSVDGLCEECFDEVISRHCNDPDAGKREMEYIESNFNEDVYKSEGKYPDHNNGYNWPKRTWGIR